MRCLRLAFLLSFVFVIASTAAHAQVALEYAPPVTTSILPPNPHASEPGLLFISPATRT